MARSPAPPLRCARAAAGLRAAAALLLAALAPACGESRETELPPACRAGEATVQTALAAAPRAVTVDGTSLSACLTPSGAPADIQEVGAVYVAVASDLAARARTDPDGPAAVRLGYLVGAVRRGAAQTQGIHTELVRRLELEAASLGPASPAFREGERAGRRSG